MKKLRMLLAVLALVVPMVSALAIDKAPDFNSTGAWDGHCNDSVATLPTECNSMPGTQCLIDGIFQPAFVTATNCQVALNFQ